MAFAQLTERQKHVYEFIHDLITNRGYGPTVREIGAEFNISSPNGVMCHLKALEKKGLIRRSPNKSRAIELVNEKMDPDYTGPGSSGLNRRTFSDRVEALVNHVDLIGRVAGVPAIVSRFEKK